MIRECHLYEQHTYLELQTYLATKNTESNTGAERRVLCMAGGFLLVAWCSSLAFSHAMDRGRPPSTCLGLKITEAERCSACLNPKAKATCLRKKGFGHQMQRHLRIVQH